MDGQKISRRRHGRKRHPMSPIFGTVKPFCIFTLFGNTVAGIFRKGSRTRRSHVRIRPASQKCGQHEAANQGGRRGELPGEVKESLFSRAATRPPLCRGRGEIAFAVRLWVSRFVNRAVFSISEGGLTLAIFREPFSAWLKFLPTNSRTRFAPTSCSLRHLSDAPEIICGLVGNVGEYQHPVSVSIIGCLWHPVCR